MLPTDELAAIRADAEDWLPDRVTLTGVTQSWDGGEVNTATAVIWNGRGRLSPLMVTERVFSDDVAAIADAVLTLPYDCPVTERNTATVYVAGATTGTDYEIVKVSSQHSLQLHVRAAVVRVK